MAGTVMDILESHDKVEIQDTVVDGQYRAFLEKASNGILCVTHAILGDTNNDSLTPETYRFAKWVRKNKKDFQIDVDERRAIKDLRSGDYWMPLVLLASDVTVQMYINLVSNYIYDMVRGALRHDVKTIHLEAVYQDKPTGKIKKFSYSGTIEGLEKAMKKFDVNKFLKD